MVVTRAQKARAGSNNAPRSKSQRAIVDFCVPLTSINQQDFSSSAGQRFSREYVSSTPSISNNQNLNMTIRDSQRNEVAEDPFGYLIGNWSVDPGLQERSSILSMDLPEKNPNLLNNNPKNISTEEQIDKSYGLDNEDIKIIYNASYPQNQLKASLISYMLFIKKYST